MVAVWVVIVCAGLALGSLAVVAGVAGSRRAVAGSLVLFVAFMGTIVIQPTPAFAAGVCPPGFTESFGTCLDMNGKYGGYLKNGKFVPKWQPPAVATAPQPLNKPSSVLAGANGSGGNAAANSLRARANGLANKIGLATRIGQAYAVVQAAQLGFTVGKGIASLACSWGADVLCYPDKRTDFAANSDVPLPNEPGWSQQTCGPYTNNNGGSSGGQPQSISCKLTWSGTPPALNSTPSSTAVAAALTGQFTTTAIYYSGGSGVSQIQAMCKTITAGQSHGDNVNSPQYGPHGENLGGTSSLFFRIPASQPPGTFNITPAAEGAGQDPALCAGKGGVQGFQIQTVSGTTPKQIYWWADGSQYRPPVTTTNPVRTLRTINTCSNGTSTQSDSAQFQETDATFPSYPIAAPCAAGSLVKVEVYERAAGLSDKLIWSMTIPQAVSDFAGGVSFPNSGDCGKNAGQGCVLGLYRKTDPNAGDCFTDVSRCQGWFKSSTRDTDYQCTYGPVGTKVNVDIRECYVYSVTFEPAYRARGINNGDPADGTPPESLDPTDPSTGTGNDPAQPGGAGKDGGNDDGDPSCYPSGWSVFNPVEWIVRPLMCVLKYLFIPDSDALSDLSTDLSASLGGTSLSAWGNSLSGVGKLTGIASNGCGGALFHVPDLGPLHLGNQDQNVFSTCEQPWSTVSTVVKALLFLAIAWGTIMGCYRILGPAFGLNVPAGGK